MAIDYLSDTLDALMMASEMGEFTKKEWYKLTQGMTVITFNALRGSGLFTIRKEHIGDKKYMSTIGYIIYYPDGSTEQFQYFGDVFRCQQIARAARIPEFKVEEIKVEKITPIYRYWYTVNPDNTNLKYFFSWMGKDSWWRVDWAEELQKARKHLANWERKVQEYEAVIKIRDCYN